MSHAQIGLLREEAGMLVRKFEFKIHMGLHPPGDEVNQIAVREARAAQPLILVKPTNQRAITTWQSINFQQTLSVLVTSHIPCPLRTFRALSNTDIPQELKPAKRTIHPKRVSIILSADCVHIEP